MFNNKLPVGLSLIKRGWKGDGNCYVCGLGESIDHIFFRCVLAKMFWTILKEVFDLESIPRSLMELSEVWLQGKGPLPIRLIMFSFAGLSWILWIARNKMATEKTFPKSPSDVLSAALSLVQKWTTLLKEGDRLRILQMKDMVVCWMRNFSPSTTVPTDVYEI
jgi:hypothetical protein